MHLAVDQDVHFNSGLISTKNSSTITSRYVNRCITNSNGRGRAVHGRRWPGFDVPRRRRGHQGGLELDRVRQLGRAAGVALVGLDLQEVLGARDGPAGELDVARHGRVERADAHGVRVRAGHAAVIDDVVGELVQSRLHGRGRRSLGAGHGGRRRAGDVLDDDGLRRVGLVELRREGEGERLADEVAEARVGGGVVAGGAAAGHHAVANRAGADERHGLRLVLERRFQVLAFVHDVVALGAHAARAVDVRVARLADAHAHLARVPVGLLGHLGGADADAAGNYLAVGIGDAGVVAVDGAEGHVLGVDALAVARAVVLAGLEAAAAARVALEALAVARAAVADADAGALGVRVDVARLVGAGRPGDLVGAAAVRAVAAVLVAHDPVLVARARVVGAARAVAAARVRAGGVRRRGREGEEGELHEWRVRGAASMPEKRGCPQIA